MIELSQLSVLIMIEVMLGLAVLCGVLGYFTIARKERIRKAAHHLAERVQNDNPPRSERLKTLLGEQYGLTGNELEQALHNITQAEMQLFQNLINGYMKDDQVHLQQVDVDEENLVLAYQGLKPVQQVAAAPPTASDAGGDEEELQQLRDENKRLSDELRVTMDTMGRMLNEYSSMFSGGVDKPLTRSAAESAEEPVGEGEEPELAAEAQSDEDGNDTEIPELAAEEVAAESLADDPDQLLDNAAEASSTLDEEVSEIIDEVMEIADEMTQHDEERTEPETPSADSAESLLDELEQVDIELPESAPPAHNEERAEVESEPEPGSLEEEWAKLLEEDAAGKEKPESK
ncbi:MAG: hypothetical protein P8103_09640 [Candidatus Thiodiazotropha sp.]